jgi:nitrate/TMAO reductase-like tetraheme cytochrome c subunit
MRFIPALALAAAVLLSGVGSVGAQEKLVNEIGNVTIEGNSKIDMFRPEKDQDTIPRNFQKQPPLIPHSVKGYNITQNFNKCMDCHSKERAEETGATKVAKSHYLDREDKKQIQYLTASLFLPCSATCRNSTPSRSSKTPTNRLPRRGNDESRKIHARMGQAHWRGDGCWLFVAGIVFWGGFNWALEATNKESFCISCHEMEENVFKEYQNTIHYTNRTGVRATCPDCHVPKEWGPKMVRKIQASNEVLHKLLGTSIRQRSSMPSVQLAQNEWDRMKANDSRECRNCHRYDYMDYTEQGNRAARMHPVAFDRRQDLY